MEAPNVVDPKGPTDIRDEMQKLMDDAVVIVRGQADKVETGVVTPIYESYRDLAQKHPTGAVFFLVFTLLSLFPIAAFITFAAVVFASFTAIALSSAIIAAASLCTAAGTLLLFVLGFILGVSVCATLSYVSIRLGYRLVFHLSSEEGKGVAGWVHETIAFFGLTTAAYSASEYASKKGLLKAEGSEESDTDIKVERKKDGKGEEGSADEWSSVDRNLPPSRLESHTIDGPHPEAPMI